jgi:hypothetical protein
MGDNALELGGMLHICRIGIRGRHQELRRREASRQGGPSLILEMKEHHCDGSIRAR